MTWRKRKDRERERLTAFPPVKEPRVAGRYPAIEKGLVRIFGRPWGGSKEFLASTEPEPKAGPPGQPGRGKKRERT